VRHLRRQAPILSLSALGLVFRGYRNEPAYTFKTILGTAEASPDAGVVLGALSLVLWTLFIITTVKYVSFAMRVDNDGEGGILPLMALLGVKKHQRPAIVAVGLFGAALIYGDGAITPAISVLSGRWRALNMVTPATAALCRSRRRCRSLLALFAISHRALQRSVTLCPVMLVWFLAIATMGITGIVQHPSVFAASIPVYVCPTCSSHGATAFGAGRGVSLRHRRRGPLCRYGHFGRGRSNLPGSPCVSKPILKLCGADCARAEGATTDGNIFFGSAPRFF